MHCKILRSDVIDVVIHTVFSHIPAAFHTVDHVKSLRQVVEIIIHNIQFVEHRLPHIAHNQLVYGIRLTVVIKHLVFRIVKSVDASVEGNQEVPFVFLALGGFTLDDLKSPAVLFLHIRLGELAHLVRAFALFDNILRGLTAHGKHRKQHGRRQHHGCFFDESYFFHYR